MSLKQEIKLTSDGLKSTFERWKSRNKIIHKDLLQTSFRMAFRLGYLMGQQKRFEDLDNGCD